MTDKQKAERFQQEQMVEDFYQKWKGQPCPGAEEELDYDEQVRREGQGKKEEEEIDYDEEVKREERMQDEVDKFFDDSDSDVELTMLHSKTNTSKKHMKVDTLALKEDEVMMKCKRCGKEGVSRCSLCKIERYCGATCQGLDWPQHKKVCGPVNKLRVKGSGDEGFEGVVGIKINSKNLTKSQPRHD